jgi:hypothetical protein
MRPEKVSAFRDYCGKGWRRFVDDRLTNNLWEFLQAWPKALVELGIVPGPDRKPRRKWRQPPVEVRWRGGE